MLGNMIGGMPYKSARDGVPQPPMGGGGLGGMINPQPMQQPQRPMGGLSGAIGQGGQMGGSPFGMLGQGGQNPMLAMWLNKLLGGRS